VGAAAPMIPGVTHHYMGLMEQASFFSIFIFQGDTAKCQGGLVVFDIGIIGIIGIYWYLLVW
jgi:hypothetical protein